MSSMAPDQAKPESPFVSGTAERSATMPMKGLDFRYLAVAASCAVAHNTTMIVGDLAGLHYLQSTAISFVLVGLWGYALHARFTFRVSASVGSLTRYALAMASNCPLWIALMFVLCDLMGVAVPVAAPAATGMLFVWNFAASRWAITGRPFLGGTR
jgi:putative flippase GtrA